MGLSAPDPSLHTHLIQEAVVQGQIGGRIGGKNGGCLFGTSHCQVPTCVVLEGIFRREGEREREKETQEFLSVFIPNHCEAALPTATALAVFLCYRGRECRSLLKHRKQTTVAQSSRWGAWPRACVLPSTWPERRLGLGGLLCNGTRKDRIR